MKKNTKQPWQVRIVTFLVNAALDLLLIALLVGVIGLIGANSSWCTLVMGSSMEPTLHSFQIIFADTSGEIQRGDIITAQSPYDERVVVKRVVGMPGDAVFISEDGVFINGKLLEEDYLTGAARKSTCEQNKKYAYLLEEDEYFLMGDNRAVSQDSRHYGPVSGDRIRCEQKAAPDWIFFVKLVILLIVGYLTCRPLYDRGQMLADRVRDGILKRMGFPEVVNQVDADEEKGDAS